MKKLFFIVAAVFALVGGVSEMKAQMTREFHIKCEGYDGVCFTIGTLSYTGKATMDQGTPQTLPAVPADAITTNSILVYGITPEDNVGWCGADVKIYGGNAIVITNANTTVIHTEAELQACQQ